MSYYDWVKNFNVLKTSPMDENIIKKLEDKIMYKNDYIINKFFGHVLDTINIRLNNICYRCIDQMLLNKTDVDTLSLDFINLKKEKNYVLKIANLPIFEQELKDILIDTINNRYTDICEVIRKNIVYIDYDGSYITAFEKIISSDMEG